MPKDTQPLVGKGRPRQHRILRFFVQNYCLWHHQHYGHEFEQTAGVDEGQKPGMPQSRVTESSDMTERLN